MIPEVAVSHSPLDALTLRALVSDPAAGAIVVFEGTARDHHQDQAVESLAYEAFVPMAEAELVRLRTEAMNRFSLCRCAIHHRIGAVPLLQAAVVVAVSSAHRKEAFEAAAWLMDRIKESVPIWKKERYLQGGDAWVEGAERHPPS
ncbi:MAG: molybdenum cofactor biosynthesis protein MoaE [Acidobacteriota bacterium]|nr:molybdenum cofactor biosynthesis protein MoaE [Acidobacteriota bacterium]